MFNNWKCVVNGEIVWEESITNSEAFARSFDCLRKYKDCEVYVDPLNHRLLVGHFGLE